MTSLSITSIQLDSISPKDGNGHKFWGIARADASVAPITLVRGIGASVSDSGFLFSSMGVGTQVRGEVLSGFYPLVGVGGLYLETPGASIVSSGQLQSIQSTKEGALVSEGFPKSTSLLTTSANTLSSMIIYGLYVSGVGVTAGDTIVLGDGDDSRITHVFEAANQSKFYEFYGGLRLSSGVKVVQGISGGAASATILYI